MVRRRRCAGAGLRDRRRLRGGQRGGGRGQGAGAGEGRRGGRHHRDGRRPLLPRWGHRRSDRHRPPGQRRGDVLLPGRGVPRPRARQDPGLLRGQRRALRLARGPRVRVRAQLLPGQGRGAARHRGAVLHRQREGLAVLRAGQAGPTGTFGPGSRRARRGGDGDRPAGQARRRTGCAGALRDRGDQPGRRRRRRRRRGALEALRRDRCHPGQGGGDRRRRLRDEPRHGRQAHPGAGPAAQDQAPRPGGALHPRQPQRRRSGHPAG